MSEHLFALEAQRHDAEPSAALAYPYTIEEALLDSHRRALESLETVQDLGIA